MVSVSQQISSGLSALGKAFALCFSKSFIGYFTIPILINIAFVALIWFVSGNLSDWFNSLMGLQENAEGWQSFFYGATTVATKIVLFAIFIFVGGYVAILLMSPVYTILSEKTDTKITGKVFSSGVKQTFKDIWRALKLAIVNTAKQTLIAIGCFIIGFVPVVGTIAAPILLFVSNAYFYGFSFMDYTNERYRRDTTTSKNIVWRYKWLAITIGALYAVSLYMFCGLFFAAFTGGVSTVAACIAQLEIENKYENEQN